MEEFFAQFWHLIVTFINPLNLQHPEKYLEALQTQGAIWPSLIAVNAIVFAETGLLVGFFFPGDSMLVVVGIFARAADWPIAWFLVTLCAAAIVGDSFGYWIGKKAGPALFSRPNGRIFKQKHLQRAKAFYEKHGGKTIIIARFIPIIRTFVPAVAGAVKMNYRTFLFYNVIGGIGWIVGMLMIGYMLDPLLKRPWMLGPQFEIAKHIDKVIIVVVLLSLAPVIWKWWTHRRSDGEPTPPAGPAPDGEATATAPDAPSPAPVSARTPAPANSGTPPVP